MDADGNRVSSGLYMSLSFIFHAPLNVLLQSGISPPILPCIHASLSPELVAALVEDPHSEELTVAIPFIISFIARFALHGSNIASGRCCARTGGFDEQAWSK